MLELLYTAGTPQGESQLVTEYTTFCAKGPRPLWNALYSVVGLQDDWRISDGHGLDLLLCCVGPYLGSI